MRDSRSPGTGPLWPCPNCQHLAPRVQRRRWTKPRLLGVLAFALIVTVALIPVLHSVPFAALLGVMVFAVGFAISPIQYRALSCDYCGLEEEIK